jgi:Protein phosphatase 2C
VTTPAIPEIIDAISLAGSRAKVNDDTYGMAGHRIWVIDGATGLGDPLLPGHSDAAWVARTANRLLHAHHGVRDTVQLVQAVIAGILSAFEAERLRPPGGRWELPCASLLLLTLTPDAVEAAWLGDCRGILDIGGTLHTCGETPEGEAAERAWAGSLGGHLGAGAMLRSAQVIQALRDSRDSYNTGRGRWVLGLEPAAAQHMEHAVFAREGTVRGLLMSDGYSALELKYQRYGARALLDASSDKGLAAMGVELRAIEEIEDPAGARWPRFKQSDDATAVLFRA